MLYLRAMLYWSMASWYSLTATRKSPRMRCRTQSLWLARAFLSKAIPSSYFCSLPVHRQHYFNQQFRQIHQESQCSQYSQHKAISPSSEQGGQQCSASCKINSKQLFVAIADTFTITSTLKSKHFVCNCFTCSISCWMQLIPVIFPSG